MTASKTLNDALTEALMEFNRSEPRNDQVREDRAFLEKVTGREIFCAAPPLTCLRLMQIGQITLSARDFVAVAARVRELAAEAA